MSNSLIFYEKAWENVLNTGCPTNMLTSSGFLKTEKSHMSKSMPCFEVLGKKLLDGTLKPGKIKLEVVSN